MITSEELKRLSDAATVMANYCKDDGNAAHEQIGATRYMRRLWAAEELLTELAETLEALARRDDLPAPRADVEAAVRETWEEAAKVADFFQDEAEQKKDQFLGGSNPWNGYRIAAGHYSNVAAAIRARSDAEGERP